MHNASHSASEINIARKDTEFLNRVKTTVQSGGSYSVVQGHFKQTVTGGLGSGSACARVPNGFFGGLKFTSMSVVLFDRNPALIKR